MGRYVHSPVGKTCTCVWGCLVSGRSSTFAFLLWLAFHELWAHTFLFFYCVALWHYAPMVSLETVDSDMLHGLSGAVHTNQRACAVTDYNDQSLVRFSLCHKRSRQTLMRSASATHRSLGGCGWKVKSNRTCHLICVDVK